MRLYSDPEREHETHALPDVEVFRMTASDFINSDEGSWMHERMSDDLDADADALAGFYYWYCFPGCMPEGDPIGPFRLQEQAIEDMRDNAS